MTELKREDILLLFDVDGTLTPARKVIEPDFEEFLYTKVKPRATLGVVGGSDIAKIIEQLNGEKVLSEFDYVLAENGLVHFEKGIEVSRQSIQKHFGEAVLQRLINFCLHYIADLSIPVKRGTFIEFRSGMINISPIGRQCSYEERLEFNKYDSQHLIRQKFIEALNKEFADVDFKFSLGGQISIDAFPIGWDKTYCLKHVTKGTNFKEIHFFGDKTDPGGNDFEIFEHPLTIGHSVVNPDDTRRQLEQLLNL